MAAPTKGSQLAALHALACQAMIDSLKGEPIMEEGSVLRDSEGNILCSGPTAAKLREVREFLKDHNIDQELKEGTGIYKVSEAAKKYQDEVNDPLLTNDRYQVTSESTQ